MILSSVLMLVGLGWAVAAGAQPVPIPPAERLAPLRYDFPRPGPAIALSDRWEDLTQGENIALGRPYRFDRKPNYGVTADAGDATQLTDGKLVETDRIWYSKEAVGYAGADPPPTICIDLGQVQPIRAVVVRMQGGGAHEASFRYPLQFDIYVSDDDQTYTRVDSLRKKEYRDQQGSALFDLPEGTGNYPPGNPHVHAFNFGNLKTRGRYLAVRLTLAGAYNALDEIAVLKGDHDPASVRLDPREATRLVFGGLELLYPRDYLEVPTNVAGGFSFAVRDSRADNKKPVTLVLDAPAGLTLGYSGTTELITRDLTRDGQPRRESRLTLTVSQSYLGYFYVRGEPGLTGELRFWAEAEGYRQPEQRVRLEAIEIPPAPELKHLVFGHGWTGVGLQSRWPGGPAALRHLGFTHASVGSWEMPSHYETPEAAESQRWLDEVARPGGLKVCLTDSPFHIMEALWSRQPDFAEAYAQTDPPSKRLCISYRGKYYQQELERLAQRVRFRKPDLLFWDIECFGGAASHVEQCSRCRAEWQKRGKSAAEVATDLVAEMGLDIARVVNEAAAAVGRPHPQIGIYHLGPGNVYHGSLDFAKLYPQAIQIANPEVYCRAWPPAVAEIIRFDKRGLKPETPLIAWTSPGTLNWEGEAPPPRLFDAYMEQFGNGALGTVYYIPLFMCPGDLNSQALAARLMAPLEDLLAHSTLCDTTGWLAGDQGQVSAVSRGEEQLVVVADYSQLGPSEVTVRVPLKAPATAVDLLSGRETKLTPDRNELTVRVEGAYRSRPIYVGNDWERRRLAVKSLPATQ
jgi:hypothetical protein